MNRTIGLVAAALAATALACGADERNIDTNGEEILPPEKSFEEVGLDDPAVYERSNLAHLDEIAQVFEGSERRGIIRASDNGGRRARMDQYAGGGKPGPGTVFGNEAFSCTPEGQCQFDTIYHDVDGNVIPDDVAAEMGLPVDAEPIAGQPVQGEPPNYWAGDIASVGNHPGAEKGRGTGPQAPAPGSAVTACTGGPDVCNVGFEPWCNGGVGKISPGGITESGIGCRGSSIKHGGPGRTRPDNSNIRVTYWSGAVNSCADTTFASAPELSYLVDLLNSDDRTLPPPFQFVRENCAFDGMPRGWGYCNESQEDICPYTQGDPNANGSMVDVVYQYDVLFAVAQDHWCEEARNTQAGRNRASAVTFGCTSFALETVGGAPKIRSWNNGYTTSNYWTMRGALVTLDLDRISWWANRPVSELDRGGMDASFRAWVTQIHVAAHELGHSVGLQHAYAGPDGTPRWQAHNHAPNAMIINPNIVPNSVMQRSVPAAPYTLNKWSSGLAANLFDYVNGTSGLGNAEAWRLSNQFRSVSDGFTTFPTSTFGPPMNSGTAGEL